MHDTHNPHVNNNPTKHDYGGYEWVTFGSYVGIHHYYIKKGITPSNDNLITLATFCDTSLLDDAYQIALSYHEIGPISIAIYIDQHYTKHISEHMDKPLKYTLKDTFDLNNKYDITIAILYYNKSSSFYQSRKEFYKDSDSKMFLNIPMNALRNLAEYQVSTKWLFSADIDFVYFSKTFHGLNNYIESISNELNINDNYIFIVPTFEIIHSLGNNDSINMYKSLDMKQLMDYVKDNKIDVFHAKLQGQKCTNYERWYNMDDGDKYYEIEYKILGKKCEWGYEPWYIMLTNVSRMDKYRWDSNFAGRGYNKVERAYTLRHYCFKFLVLNHVFMIHKQSLHRKEKPDQKEVNYWNAFNKKLFNQKRISYYLQKDSCTFNYDTDTWYTFKYLWRKYLNRYYIPISSIN